MSRKNSEIMKPRHCSSREDYNNDDDDNNTLASIAPVCKNTSELLSR